MEQLNTTSFTMKSLRGESNIMSEHRLLDSNKDHDDLLENLVTMALLSTLGIFLMLLGIWIDS